MTPAYVYRLPNGDVWTWNGGPQIHGPAYLTLPAPASRTATAFMAAVDAHYAASRPRTAKIPPSP